MASSDAACPPSASEVEIELFPFMRVYKNGDIERLLGTDTVPASLDAATGVASKDVTVDPATGLSVRLYLPPAAGGTKKLPVLVYFHGGGFMVESAASPTYHPYLNALAARAGALVVSVDYRRVPEHPLPAAYDDSWAALAWAVAGCAPAGGQDPWLAAYGDASRVFLAGDSAGVNITHNVAMRAAGATEGLALPPGAAIGGVVLVHPFFWDATNAMVPELEARIRREWRFKCARPDAEVDDPRVCPTEAALAGMPCGKVMVAVAGEDFLAPKGRAYYAALLASGWRGEAVLVDTPGQGHVFHLRQPGAEEAAEMLDRVVDFISRDA